jgi:hypothetical protein
VSHKARLRIIVGPGIGKSTLAPTMIAQPGMGVAHDQ